MRFDVSNLEYAWDEGHKLAAKRFRVVGELDEPNLSYEFNTLKVWQHTPSGRLFYATSSGCSCPTPFEEYFVELDDDLNVVATDMQEITRETLEQFERDANAFGPYADSTWSTPVPVDEKRALIVKVRDALEARNV